MERDLLITSRWVQTDRGRKRKYYEITTAGKEQLAADRAEWLSVNRLFARLWAGPGAGDLILE